MKKYAKKSLGLVLAIGMLVGQGSNVFANDTATTEPAAESSNEILAQESQDSVTEVTLPAEVPAEEIVEEVEQPVEEAVVMEEVVEEEPAVEAVYEEPVTEVTEEEVAEPVSEEVHEDILSSPFTYHQEEENGEIDLRAAEGVLPENTNVTVTQMTLEEVKELLKDYAAAEGKEIVDAAVYNVVFCDAEGNEVQPEGEVNVTVKSPELEYEGLTCDVLRIRSAEEVDELEKEVEVKDGEVTFASDHFTPVGVVTYAERNEEPASFDNPVTYAFQYGTYEGFREYVEGQTYVYPLYVLDGNKKLVAYCFNATKAFPRNYGEQKTNYVGKFENATEEEFTLLNNKSIPNKKDNVLKTVYYGYPYNAGGIKQKYGLSDMQFRCVTQAAIWKYTDGLDLGTGSCTVNKNGVPIPDGSMFDVTYRVWMTNGVYQWQKVYNWTPAMTNAYYALTNNASFTYPKSFQLDLYAADSEGYDTPDYQNLLSTKMTLDDTPTVTVDIEVKKHWEGDAGDNDPARPTEVTVDLYANDTLKDTKKITAADGWSASFDDLPKFENGREIKYEVKEREVSGYTSESMGSAQTGYTFINTKNPETQIEVSVRKEWNDDTNRDGKRTDEVTIALYADNVDTNQRVILNDGNRWADSFRGLPEKANGRVINYTVREVNVPDGYTVQVSGTAKNGYTVTNSHTPTEAEVSVLKKWSDDNDRDKLRPAEVTVRLYANDVVTQKSVKLNERNGWTAIFKNLPEYENGNKIEYTVREDEVTGYTSQVSGTQGTGYTITNSHTPNKVAVSVTKAWNDDRNRDGLRSGSVTVKLLADGADTGKTVVLNERNNWQASFEDLEENKADGTKIRYTVQEEKVPTGYTVQVTEEATNTYTVTNTHETAKTKVSVTKAWNDNGNQDGLRSGSVTVKLLADGADTGKTVVLNNDNGWQASFEDLVVNNNGTPIKYTVQEENVPNGYTVQVTGTAATGYTVTNSHTPTEVEVSVLKKWSDDNNRDKLRPAEVTVRLYADNVETQNSVKLNEHNGWTAKFEKLPEFNNGNKISYTVKEDAVKGYTAEVTGTQETGYTITNSHAPDTVNVEGEKIWKDRENKEGKRPKSIEVTLLADGTVYGTKTVTADTGWKYSWTGLPKNKDGEEIQYTISEAEVKGYTTQVENYNLINTETTRGIEFSKKNLGGEELAGAEIEIRKGNIVVDGWTSEAKTKTIQLEPGTYTFVETVAPKGYVVVTEFEFTVNEDGTVTVINVNGNDVTAAENTLTIVDQYETFEFEISKVDLGGNEIAGAKIQILGPNNTVEKEWTSVAGKNETVSLREGTYTFHEETAPEGYNVVTNIVFSVNDQGVVTIVDNPENAAQIVDGKLVVTDTYTERKVKFSKQDLGGKELAGASIKVSGKDRSGKEIVHEWVSDGKVHELELPMGEYTMEETAAPEGYAIATTIEFTVNEDGTITVGQTTSESEDKNVVTMVDGYTLRKVKISKQDLGGNELKGASLTVSGKDHSGKEIKKSWVSDGKVHELGLPMGTYRLEETAAPNGYTVATTIEFTVNEDGTVTVGQTTSESEDTNIVTMVDDFELRKVTFSKTDLAGEELEGAEITVSGTDTAGIEHTESWTSGKTAHVLELPMGKYTMKETVAPEGYEIATTIEFTVHEDGTITVDDVRTKSEDENVVTMVDGYTDQIVTISKTDINGTKEIGGAELTVRDQGGKVVEAWTSVEDESHTVTVKPGTYTLTEERAPEGYKVAESITFTVDHFGKETVGNEEVETVTMKDDYENGKVVISKTDIAGKEIEGAELVVTDKDGNVVEKWTSEEGKNHEVSLYPGTYTLTEKTAPNGYEVAESITFTVDHLNHVTVDGEEAGKVTMVDEYSTHTVKFSKQDVNGKELKGASIELRDKDGKVVEKWVSDGKTREFEVKPGTYTFVETAAPEGYEIATSITIEVGIDGSVTSKNVTVKGDSKNLIVMVDAAKPVVPKTGVSGGNGMYGMILMTGMAAGLFLIRRRYSN